MISHPSVHSLAGMRSWAVGGHALVTKLASSLALSLQGCTSPTLGLT